MQSLLPYLVLMVSTAACRWPVWMSHAATTWQSSCARNALVFAGPIMPHPMTPMVMRFEGLVRPLPEIARAHAPRGSRAVAPATLRKSRRLMPAGALEREDCDFISFSEAGSTESLDEVGSALKITASFDT